MELDPTLHDRLRATIESHRVVLFMKGDRAAPRCGFSASVVEVLEDVGVPYETVDVLASPELREGIKAYSEWPTIPQLYVGGQFVGGADIVQQLHGSGELQALLGVQVEPVAPPRLTVSPEAAAELTRAMADAAPGERVRIVVNGRFQTQMTLDTARPGDLEVDASGIPFVFDRGSARRGDGIALGYQQQGMSRGFTLDNPNKPAGVRSMTVADLKARLDAGGPLHLFDVRTDREREVARLAQAHPWNATSAATVEALDRDAPIALMCHHGRRSLEVAEQLLARGYRNVWNVEGGIDAWSRQVDPAVPRY